MEHIIGSTFRKLCTFKDGAGAAQNIASITIKSQIRTKAGALVADVAITKLTPSSNGQFTMLVSNTALWPAETLEMDIQYTISGDIVYTDTLDIMVKERVTV